MKIVFFVLCICLSGCGAWNQVKSVYVEFTKVCVGGVEYVQFPSGAAVSVNLEGKPIACKVNE